MQTEILIRETHESACPSLKSNLSPSVVNLIFNVHSTNVARWNFQTDKINRIPDFRLIFTRVM